MMTETKPPRKRRRSHFRKRHFSDKPPDAVPLIYRLKSLEAVVGLKRTAISARIKAGTFPKPIMLGARAVGWLASEVDAWIRERAAERDAA